MNKKRTFEHFPEDTICPICKTNENKECFLMPISDTKKGNIYEAQPTHVECVAQCFDRLVYNKENGYIIESGQPTVKYPQYGSMSVYYKGLQFQNPQMDSLIYTLQNIAADREMIEKKGKRARTTIKNKFDIDVVSKKYYERLNHLWLTIRNARQ